MRNFYKFTFILLCSICAKAQIPTASIVNVSSAFCTGRSLSFSAAGSATNMAYTWSLNGSRSATLSPDNSGPVITLTVSNAGTYTVILTAVNSQTTLVISKTFNVTRSAKASFNASLSGQGFPAKLYLTDYSANSLNSYWIFNGNVADMVLAPYFVKDYNAGGNYTVTLLAKGTNGCDDASSYTFSISDASEIILPNVFSPNNDGINDVYKPDVKGILTMNAWVYNRDGVIIASWDKVNGFWDGYTTSGEQCSAGVYFIVIDANGFDGRHYKSKSSITLNR